MAADPVEDLLLARGEAGRIRVIEVGFRNYRMDIQYRHYNRY
jgi:hypothetical protein